MQDFPRFTQKQKPYVATPWYRKENWKSDNQLPSKTVWKDFGNVEDSGCYAGRPAAVENSFRDQQKARARAREKISMWKCQSFTILYVYFDILYFIFKHLRSWPDGQRAQIELRLSSLTIKVSDLWCSQQIKWARPIQPKFRPVRPGKEDHLKRWTSFSETFPVGPNRSIEFWTESSENFGWMDRAPMI